MFSKLFNQLADLAVNEIRAEVADTFAQGGIPIITAPVASGKTLVLTAACAQAVSDDPDDNVVYVLVPNRLLANNAARIMHNILSGDLIGVLNSERSGDRSILHPDNRIVFTTVGFALAAGILQSKKNFILDEAHETSIDLSLAKAILHNRGYSGEHIRLAIMSATIDVNNEMEFWRNSSASGHVVHFTAESSAFPVTFLHRPSYSIGEAVHNLITEYDRKGVLVFVSGVREIEEAKDDIETYFLVHGIHEADYEIRQIHGNSTQEDQYEATADPKTKIKILIGTNVLESGISFPWVDGGVSSGKTKVMHVNGNVHHLIEEDMPAWRIDQQEGRVRRFKPGVFILADNLNKNERPNQTNPDIVRLPLTELVMHCATFGLNFRDLCFTLRETPNPEKLREAIDILVSYGLIKEENGFVSLTKDGLDCRHLPLSFRASVAICESLRMNKVAEMLPLIAMLDVGDIRFDRRLPLLGGFWETSDIINQTVSIAMFLKISYEVGYREAQEYAKENNMNSRKIKEFDKLLTDLEYKTGVMSDFTPYLNIRDDEGRKNLDRMAKRVLFRGFIRELYRYQLTGVEIPSAGRYSSYGNSAQFSKTSAVSPFSSERMLCSGTLRKITPKQGFPFTVLEQITEFTTEDIDHLVGVIGESTVKDCMARMKYQNGLSAYFDIKESNKLSPKSKEVNFHDFEFNGRHHEPMSELPEHSEGSLADILKRALAAKAA